MSHHTLRIGAYEAIFASSNLSKHFTILRYAHNAWNGRDDDVFSQCMISA